MVFSIDKLKAPAIGGPLWAAACATRLEGATAGFPYNRMCMLICL